MATPPPQHPTALRPAPPRAWEPAHSLARAVSAPVERFLRIEAASGVVLLVSAVLAMVWANLPGGTYEALWTTPFGLELGDHRFVRDLRWWVNDGLMVVFFFVVGLEIRRELHAGELAELRRAALPVAAALGGMVVPALIYTAFNAGTAAAGGWGTPMATDIAFAVGVLALLGSRVPPALRVLLLALAVIDDLGAIVVIALFYSSGVDPGALGVAGLGVGAIVALQLFGVWRTAAYVLPALVVWAGVYAAGIHPTIAGVVVGLLTPARAWLGPEAMLATTETMSAAIREELARGGSLQGHLDEVELAAREAVSPVERMQHLLHGLVAWWIMPLFAVANAGVSLEGFSLGGDGWRVMAGVGLGLVVGKPLGVYLACRVAVASGTSLLPRGIRWQDLHVVGTAAGIGFTMALFIAQLAFGAGPELETAKVSILVSSLVAGLGTWLFGAWILRSRPVEGAGSLVEAERSTER